MANPNENDLRVICYSGYAYAERPNSFRWQGIDYEVERIEKTWREPGARCFHVHTRDNKFFQLCYNKVNEKWSLIELMRSDENDSRSP